MKGDFTRFTHRPRQHYTQVRKQQGRVDLDADWNEYVDIQSRLQRVRTRDLIGRCGAPYDRAGFKIEPTADGRDATISAGRYYVQGRLVELESPVTYLTQPYLPHPPALEPKPGQRALFYLDVWDRHITAIEDPAIREKALGGPDTTTRVQTVWQVKMMPVEAWDCRAGAACGTGASSPPGWPPMPPLHQRGKLSNDLDPAQAHPDPCLIDPQGGYVGLENRLYRVEIHDPGRLGQATFKWSRDNGAVVFAVAEFVAGEGKKVRVTRLGRDQVLALHVNDWVEISSDETELAGEPGVLAKIVKIDHATRTLTLTKDVSALATHHHPKVRRWDQAGPAIKTQAASIPLEDGLAVRFHDGDFQTGDYWAFAARAIAAEDKVELLKEAPPMGVEHVYCPLAIVEWQSEGSGEGDENAFRELQAEFVALEKKLMASELAEERKALAERIRETWDALFGLWRDCGEVTAEAEEALQALRKDMADLEQKAVESEAPQAREALYERIMGLWEEMTGIFGECRPPAVKVRTVTRDCRRIFPPLSAVQAACCTVTVGDGVHSCGQFDDIQTAIDHLPAAGGEVCVLPGDYVLEQPVRLRQRQHVTLRGCGEGARIHRPQEGPALVIRECARVTAAGLTFIGEAGPVIVIDKSREVTLADLVLTLSKGGQASAGIAAVLAGASRGVRIERNRIVIEEGALAGILVHGEDIWLRGNALTGGGVLALAGSRDLHIVENRISEGRGPGVAFALASQVQDNLPWGRDRTTLRHVVIRGNVIWGMQGSGVATAGVARTTTPALTDDLLIAENRIVGCAAGAGEDDGVSIFGGIVLANGKHVHIQHNVIEACGPAPAPTSDSPAPEHSPAPLDNRPDVSDLSTISTSSTPGNVAVRPEMLSPRTSLVSNLIAHPTLRYLTPILELAAGRKPDAPIAGVYIRHVQGLDISHNRILDNGSPHIGPRAAGRQGGIIVLSAAPNPLQVALKQEQALTMADGYPAAKIHNNTVIVPRGPALFVRGSGPMAISDNQFTSQGALPLAKDQRHTTDTPTLPLGFLGAVQIINVGVADELLGMFKGFLAMATTADEATRPPTLDRPPDLSDVPLDGSVSFCNNQVTFNLLRSEQEMGYASVLVFSLDDIGFHDNQLDVILQAQDKILANAIIAGLRLRASGNAFKETLQGVVFSCISQGILNSTSFNQGNHCILAKAHAPAWLQDVGNIALVCKLKPQEFTVYVTTPQTEAPSARKKEAKQAALAYRNVLQFADRQHQVVLKDIQELQRKRVTALRSERAALEKTVEKAAPELLALDAELAALQALKNRIDEMITP